MRQKLTQHLLWPNVCFKTSWTRFDFFKQPSGIFHKRCCSLKVQRCVFVRLCPRCRSALIYRLDHFFQRYYKNSQMYKPHKCYIIRSLQHEFILCETGSDPCFIYIIIMGCTTASGQPHFNSSSLSPNKNQSYDPWCSAVLFPYCVSLYNDNSKNNNYSVPWNLFPDCWIVNTHMSQICLTF